MAGGTGSALAKGGMLTKVLAAKRAARSGAHTVIASGREPDVLVRLARGEASARCSPPRTVPLAARKQWLADHLTVSGRLRLDAGAVKALARDGKSLLPIGVVRGHGRIRARRSGRLPRSRRAARWRAAWSTIPPTRRAGSCAGPRPRSRPILGYVDEPELIHRDNLVLL